uniref:Uncharacterized protein n=1 Tax=Mycena chlorophos TaxID=658473 RepID=A0ABQ0LDT8_MYCCL|nr:predicted protein [Mycena chlorophos]
MATSAQTLLQTITQTEFKVLTVGSKTSGDDLLDADGDCPMPLAPNHDAVAAPHNLFEEGLHYLGINGVADVAHQTTMFCSESTMNIFATSLQRRG